MTNNLTSSCCQAGVLFTLNEHDLPNKAYCVNCRKPCEVKKMDWLSKPNTKDMELFDDQNNADKKD